MPHLLLSALSNILIYGGSFVVVLSIVVTVHELGHFWAARFCRIPVKSFSLGFGPQVLALRDKHNTVWKLSAIPLGGFVSWIDDTDPTSTLPPTEEQRELSPSEQRKRGYFRAQPLWARALVTAAGPISNFLFAIFAFSTLTMIQGRDATDYAHLTDHIPARIGAVQEHSAAATAGLKPGDVIVAANGQHIATFAALQGVVSASAGKIITLSVQRGAQTLALPATPQPRDRDDDLGHKRGDGFLGVGPLPLPSELTIVPANPIDALQTGVRTTWALVAQTVDYIAKIVTGRASADQIAGPLGILSASGKVASASLAAPASTPGGPIALLVLNLFTLSAMLSVAVGFVNILPIPVLDGGHLMFYGIEAARGGRPLPPRAQELAFWTGVSVLVSLFLFATWNDITKHLPGLQ